MDNIDEYGPTDVSLAQKYVESRYNAPNINAGPRNPNNQNLGSNIPGRIFGSELTNNDQNRGEFTPDNRSSYVNQLYNKYQLNEKPDNSYSNHQSLESGPRLALSSSQNWTPNVRNLVGNLKSLKDTDLLDFKTDNLYNKDDMQRLVPNDDVIELNKNTIELIKSQNTELKNQNRAM